MFQGTNLYLKKSNKLSYYGFEDKKVLGVHIQGDQKFSMYKQW